MKKVFELFGLACLILGTDYLRSKAYQKQREKKKQRKK
jgi:hypothetical protein|tara:strand:- start:368 stop:481 length:114 start_codon:yes stop_codon:yes gene_type:complete